MLTAPLTTADLAFATVAETIACELPLNGTYFGAKTARLRNAMTVSYEPCEHLRGALVEAIGSPMHPNPKPFGVIVDIGRGFHGEPVALVVGEDGRRHEVGSVQAPSGGRGAIGWHLVSADRATAAVLARVAEGLAAA